MHARLFDRRSSSFALAAWVCAALQVATFMAAGWHFHGGHGAEHGHAPSAAGDCPFHASHGDDEDTGPDGRDEAPGDGRDPDGCGVCVAIAGLQHATPVPPVAFWMPRRERLAEWPESRGVASIAALWRACARGPPGVGLSLIGA